jgi:hypothetical protein
LQTPRKNFAISSQRDIIADRLDAAGDRAEARELDEKAAQLRALADRIRGGDDCGFGCCG